MLQLFLIRHGTCNFNENPHLIGGRLPESDLTEIGNNEMQLVGKYFATRGVCQMICINPLGISFDQIFSSPLIRARKSAEILAKGNYDERLPPYPIISFTFLLLFLSILMIMKVELSQGEWEGKPKSEIYSADLLKRINSQQPHFKAPGGESQAEVEKRIADFVSLTVLPSTVAYWLLKGCPTPNPIQDIARVAIVTHSMVIKCFIRHILQSSPALTYKIQIENSSVSEFSYCDHTGWSLLSINRMSHMDTPQK